MAASQTKSQNGRARGPRVPLVTALPAPAEPAPTQVAAPPTPELDAAVLRVQAEAAKLVRNADGQIQNRFYKYVTLTAVNDEVHPLLVGEGLVWKARPTTLEDGRPALRYRMTHIESGEADEDTMPLLCDPTMQGLGSAITYARRYALVSYLNLTVDEDDDGLSANTPPRDKYEEAAAAHAAIERSRQPTAAPPKPAGRPATVKQRNMLRKKAKDAKLTEGQLANVVLEAAGDAQRTWRNDEHASATLSRLLDRLPGQLVDAVIAGIAHASAEGSQA